MRLPLGYSVVSPFAFSRWSLDTRWLECVESYRNWDEPGLNTVNTTKKKKKTALVICNDGKEFWTTQTQFWQWFRDGVIEKAGDRPLTGLFCREHQELLALLSKSALNPAHQDHKRDVLLSRKAGVSWR